MSAYKKRRSANFLDLRYWLVLTCIDSGSVKENSIGHSKKFNIDLKLSHKTHTHTTNEGGALFWWFWGANEARGAHLEGGVRFRDDGISFDRGAHFHILNFELLNYVKGFTAEGCVWCLISTRKILVFLLWWYIKFFFTYPYTLHNVATRLVVAYNVLRSK